jgi:hypothetical protein
MGKSQYHPVSVCAYLPGRIRYRWLQIGNAGFIGAFDKTFHAFMFFDIMLGVISTAYQTDIQVISGVSLKITRGVIEDVTAKPFRPVGRKVLYESLTPPDKLLVQPDDGLDHLIGEP